MRESRRRSPENSRRPRRESRRGSGERLTNLPPMPMPVSPGAYTNSHTDTYASTNLPPSPLPPPPTSTSTMTMTATTATGAMPHGQDRRQRHSSPPRQSRRQRPRAPSSVHSSSSSISSSFLDISRHYPHTSRFGGLFTAFFRAPSERSRRSRRRSAGPRKRRILYFGNSSSSSVNSDLAYGNGYIANPKSARNRSPRRSAAGASNVAAAASSAGSTQYYQQQPQQPFWGAADDFNRSGTRKAQTDEEILEIGRQLQDFARKQNEHDLRTASRARPAAGLMAAGAAAAVVRDGQRRKRHGASSRGIGSSRPHTGSSADESDWESASEDESSDDADSELAYGSVVSHPIRPAAPSAMASGLAGPSTSSRQSSMVDPRLFGPVNSLRGLVTPQPFGPDGTAVPSGQHESFNRLRRADTDPVRATSTKKDYSSQTRHARNFNATTAPTTSTPRDLPYRPRAEPLPLQQPVPLTPVSPSLYETGKLEGVSGGETRDARPLSGDKNANEVSFAGIAAAAATAAALAFDRRQRRDGRRASRKAIDTDGRASEKRRSSHGRDDEKRDHDRRADDKDSNRWRRESDAQKEKRMSKPDSYAPGNADDGDRMWTSRSECQDDARTWRETAVDAYQEPGRSGRDNLRELHDAGAGKVDEDAALKAQFAPERPLTPTIITVEREPVFDDMPVRPAKPAMRQSRMDSFEIDGMPENAKSPRGADSHAAPRRRYSYEEEEHEAKGLYDEIRQSTIPVGVAAVASAIAVEAARSRERRRDQYSDDGSREHYESVDVVQEEANRRFREAAIARKIAEDEVRSRSHSPDRSVLDKYSGDDATNESAIVTPPEYEDSHKGRKSRYDAPDADVRIDNKIYPQEIPRFRATGSGGDASFSSRDPSCERERPLLNLVFPTPISSRHTTPSPENLHRGDGKDGAGDRRESSSRQFEPAKDVHVAEGEPQGDQVQSGVAKSVTWGENSTKTFAVMTPEPSPDFRPSWEQSEDVERPHLDETNKRGTDMIERAHGTTSIEPANEPEEDWSPKAKPPAFDTTSPDQPFEHVSSAVPPIPGPKPSGSLPNKMPGAFADDIEFAATLAAGLQDTGFDPNIVIDDPAYRRRGSPPGESGPTGDSWSREEARPVAAESARGVPVDSSTMPELGCVIAEPGTAWDTPIVRTEEPDVPAKLSKKEKKKLEKLKRQSAELPEPGPLESETPPSESTTGPLRGLSKKEQRRREKELRTLALLQGDEVAGNAEIEPLEAHVVGDDQWEESGRSKSKKNRKSRDLEEDAPSKVSVPVDEFDDLQSLRKSEPDDEWMGSKKSKKKSKRSTDLYESGSRAPFDGSTSSRSSKSKRSGAMDDDNDDEVDAIKSGPPDRALPAPFEDRDVSSVVSESRAEVQKRGKREKRRSSQYEDDDAKSVASAPGSSYKVEDEQWKKRDGKKPSRKNDHDDAGSVPLAPSPSRRGKDEDEGMSSRYDDDSRSIASAPGSSRQSNGAEEKGSTGIFSSLLKLGGKDEKKESFLDNAGTPGAGVGFATVAAAAILTASRSNAADDSSEKEHNFPDDAEAVQETGVIDPEVAARAIKPAIDPQYGDLLPLPPSEPASPKPTPEELPSLPSSRPDTPPDERNLKRDYETRRRRSIQETPIKSPSSTAIPISLRIGQRGGPATPMSASLRSPMGSPMGTPDSASRRQARISWDSSREIKPLYLLEHARHKSADNVPHGPSLPELPLSEPSDRDSPAPRCEDPEASGDNVHQSIGDDDIADVGFRIDTNLAQTALDRDLAGSQETTPRAGVKPETPGQFPLENEESQSSNYSEPDPIESMSKDRSSYLLLSTPSSVGSMRVTDDEGLAQNPWESSPSKLGKSTALHDILEDLPSADEHFSDAREASPEDVFEEARDFHDAPASQVLPWMDSLNQEAGPEPTRSAATETVDPDGWRSMTRREKKGKAKKALQSREMNLADDTVADDSGTATNIAGDMPTVDHCTIQPELPQDAFKSQKKGKKGKKGKNKQYSWDDDLGDKPAEESPKPDNIDTADMLVAHDDPLSKGHEAIRSTGDEDAPPRALHDDDVPRDDSVTLDGPTYEVDTAVAADSAIPSTSERAPQPSVEADFWENTSKKGKKRKNKKPKEVALWDENPAHEIPSPVVLPQVQPDSNPNLANAAQVGQKDISELENDRITSPQEETVKAETAATVESSLATEANADDSWSTPTASKMSKKAKKKKDKQQVFLAWGETVMPESVPQTLVAIPAGTAADVGSAEAVGPVEVPNPGIPKPEADANITSAEHADEAAPKDVKFIPATSKKDKRKKKNTKDVASSDEPQVPEVPTDTTMDVDTMNDHVDIALHEPSAVREAEAEAPPNESSVSILASEPTADDPEDMRPMPTFSKKDKKKKRKSLLPDEPMLVENETEIPTNAEELQAEVKMESELAESQPFSEGHASKPEPIPAEPVYVPVSKGSKKKKKDKRKSVQWEPDVPENISVPEHDSAEPAHHITVEEPALQSPEEVVAEPESVSVVPEVTASDEKSPDCSHPSLCSTAGLVAPESLILASLSQEYDNKPSSEDVRKVVVDEPPSLEQCHSEPLFSQGEEPVEPTQETYSLEPTQADDHYFERNEGTVMPTSEPVFDQSSVVFKAKGKKSKKKKQSTAWDSIENELTPKLEADLQLPTETSAAEAGIGEPEAVTEVIAYEEEPQVATVEEPRETLAEDEWAMPTSGKKPKKNKKKGSKSTSIVDITPVSEVTSDTIETIVMTEEPAIVAERSKNPAVDQLDPEPSAAEDWPQVTSKKGKKKKRQSQLLSILDDEPSIVTVLAETPKSIEVPETAVNADAEFDVPKKAKKSKKKDMITLSWDSREVQPDVDSKSSPAQPGPASQECVRVAELDAQPPDCDAFLVEDDRASIAVSGAERVSDSTKDAPESPPERTALETSLPDSTVTKAPPVKEHDHDFSKMDLQKMEAKQSKNEEVMRLDSADRSNINSDTDLFLEKVTFEPTDSAVEHTPEVGEAVKISTSVEEPAVSKRREPAQSKEALEQPPEASLHTEWGGFSLKPSKKDKKKKKAKDVESTILQKSKMMSPPEEELQKLDSLVDRLESQETGPLIEQESTLEPETTIQTTSPGEYATCNEPEAKAEEEWGLGLSKKEKKKLKKKKIALESVSVESASPEDLDMGKLGQQGNLAVDTEASIENSSDPRQVCTTVEVEQEVPCDVTGAEDFKEDLGNIETPSQKAEKGADSDSTDFQNVLTSRVTNTAVQITADEAEQPTTESQPAATNTQVQDDEWSTASKKTKKGKKNRRSQVEAPSSKQPVAESLSAQSPENSHTFAIADSMADSPIPNQQVPELTVVVEKTQVSFDEQETSGIGLDADTPGDAICYEPEATELQSSGQAESTMLGTLPAPGLQSLNTAGPDETWEGIPRKLSKKEKKHRSQTSQIESIVESTSEIPNEDPALCPESIDVEASGVPAGEQGMTASTEDVAHESSEWISSSKSKKGKKGKRLALAAAGVATATIVADVLNKCVEEEAVLPKVDDALSRTEPLGAWADEMDNVQPIIQAEPSTAEQNTLREDDGVGFEIPPKKAKKGKKGRASLSPAELSSEKTAILSGPERTSEVAIPETEQPGLGGENVPCDVDATGQGSTSQNLGGFTTVEADSEWAMPVKKKGKKGRKGKGGSLGMPADDADVPSQAETIAPATEDAMPCADDIIENTPTQNQPEPIDDSGTWRIVANDTDEGEAGGMGRGDTTSADDSKPFEPEPVTTPKDVAETPMSEPITEPAHEQPIPLDMQTEDAPMDNDWGLAVKTKGKKNKKGKQGSNVVAPANDDETTTHTMPIESTTNDIEEQLPADLTTEIIVEQKASLDMRAEDAPMDDNWGVSVKTKGKKNKKSKQGRGIITQANKDETVAEPAPTELKESTEDIEKPPNMEPNSEIVVEEPAENAEKQPPVEPLVETVVLESTDDTKRQAPMEPTAKTVASEPTEDATKHDLLVPIFETLVEQDSSNIDDSQVPPQAEAAVADDDWALPTKKKGKRTTKKDNTRSSTMTPGLDDKSTSIESPSPEVTDRSLSAPETVGPADVENLVESNAQQPTPPNDIQDEWSMPVKRKSSKKKKGGKSVRLSFAAEPAAALDETIPPEVSRSMENVPGDSAGESGGAKSDAQTVVHDDQPQYAGDAISVNPWCDVITASKSREPEEPITSGETLVPIEVNPVDAHLASTQAMDIGSSENDSSQREMIAVEQQEVAETVPVAKNAWTSHIASEGGTVDDFAAGEVETEPPPTAKPTGYTDRNFDEACNVESGSLANTVPSSSTEGPANPGADAFDDVWESDPRLPGNSTRVPDMSTIAEKEIALEISVDELLSKDPPEEPDAGSSKSFTAISGAAGGIGPLVEKFGGGKKKKKSKQKKIVDKRQAREDDIFDDPELWESADKKSLRTAPCDDCDDGMAGAVSSEEPRKAAKDPVTTVEETSAEKAALEMGEWTALATAPPAGLLRRSPDAEEPMGGLLKELSRASPGLSEYKRSPSRALPVVQEVPEAEAEAVKPSFGTMAEVKRDSGFAAEPASPQLGTGNLLSEGQQQDSGIHTDDWPEEMDMTRTPEPAKTKGREVRSSPFGTPVLREGTPVLREPAAAEATPEPEKKKSTKGRKQKDYGELGGRVTEATGATAVRGGAEREADSGADSMAGPRRSASNTSLPLSRHRTPEPQRFEAGAPGITRATSTPALTPTPPLRRVDKRMSGDLRALRQQSGSKSPTPAGVAFTTTAQEADKVEEKQDPGANELPPVANESRVRSTQVPAVDDGDMTDVFNGYGEGRIGSPRSPTRPHSMRRRQSMQVLELESRVDQLLVENRLLMEARAQAEQNLGQSHRAASALSERDAEIETLRQSLQFLQNEVHRLAEVNEGLASANAELASKDTVRHADLELSHATVTREFEEARGLHTQTLQEKEAEIADLRAQLEEAKEQIREMQRKILEDKAGDEGFLVIRDEDHFDTRCQQLCSHIQQWVLRFSKFSDMRACRLTSEINDEKTIDRLDNAVLDGSDVDSYLNDRVKRRDIFMSMTMTMMWEFVFTRYLFGMDREQRQKLKSLEKLLTEVGPDVAVRKWRAVTLTLLSRRESFKEQRDLDTEAVVQAILQTLCKILPPPSNLEDQIQSQLRRVMQEAVDLSIEMRTQRAEYMMLPPLQPEYDADGELAATVQFDASMMSERSGKVSATNEELEAQGADVRIVLFPLVIKRGDDGGHGDEKIVVCPAQVLIARDNGNRHMTPSSDVGGASLGAPSRVSVVTEAMWPPDNAEQREGAF
ncbi:hypothetical protein RJ55_00321 [Drechmeria coniospora]|nr:hypothetical protein RJ55_00321 [Drechmeria coniospora]